MIKNLGLAALLGLFSGVAVFVSVEAEGGFSVGLIFGAFMIPLVTHIHKRFDLGRVFRVVLFSGLSFPAAFFSGMASGTAPNPTLETFIVAGSIGGMVLCFGFLSKEMSQQFRLVSHVLLFGFLGGLLALPAELLDFMNSQEGALIFFTIWQTGMATAIGYILTKEKETKQTLGF